jgi:tellurite resistance protein
MDKLKESLSNATKANDELTSSNRQQISQIAKLQESLAHQTTELHNALKAREHDIPIKKKFAAKRTLLTDFIVIVLHLRLRRRRPNWRTN